MRRATVDDLDSLVELWEAMNFPAAQLERRLTDFQVVAAADGRLLGALALQITGRHGRLHSEAFRDFALADALRHQLAARMQAVAANHGLVRLWTQETAPFWRQFGMLPPDLAVAQKLPDVWGALPGNWLSLQLRDEAALEISLDQEFSRLKEAEQKNSAKVLSQARTLKTFVTVIAFIFVGVLLALSAYVLVKNLPAFRH